MNEPKETVFSSMDLVIVQMSTSKEKWEKIKVSEEWNKILNGNVTELIKKKSETEETLQSINGTLKCIERLLKEKSDGQGKIEGRANLSDGIRSLEIDLDKEILKINGQKVTDESILVALPGPEGYRYKKAFNMKNEQIPGRRGVIDVCYYSATNNKPL